MNDDITYDATWEQLMTLLSPTVGRSLYLHVSTRGMHRPQNPARPGRGESVSGAIQMTSRAMRDWFHTWVPVHKRESYYFRVSVQEHCTFVGGAVIP